MGVKCHHSYSYHTRLVAYYFSITAPLIRFAV